MSKRFANTVFIVLVIVLVGALGYKTLIKRSAPVEQPQTDNLQNTQPAATQPSSENTVSQNPSTTQSQILPTTCTDQPEAQAVITSMSTYSGSVGTQLEIRGCNFAGFEGDKNAVIENAQGISAVLYGEPESTAKNLKVSLKSPLCQEDNSYTGLPCSAYLTLTPGTYKIYVMPWGADTKSNLVTFTIQ